MRVIVFAFVSSALSTIVIRRPGPPGNARLIEYRAHQRIASPDHEFPVTVEEDRVRLGLRVNVNADSLPIVVRSVLDFKRSAAHAQGRVSPENENARRGASAVLPRRVSFSLSRLRDHSPDWTSCWRV